MDPTTAIVIAAIGALTGIIGAVGALWNLIRQGRADDRLALSKEQAEFRKEQDAYRQAQAVEIATLRQQIVELDKARDTLFASDTDKKAQLERLTERDEFKTQQLKDQAEIIATLRAQVAVLEDNKAELIQRVTVEQLRREAVERENKQLRSEITRLTEEITRLTAGDQPA